MTFSIIIAVYNVEKYIEECLQSILLQTYKDYEVILVDDGSKDSSSQICDDFASKYEQIKVLHKENGGASSARNAGLREASGEYILFLDSDDYIKSDDFLEELAQKTTSAPDVILYKYQKYYEKTDTLEECHFHFPSNIEGLTVAEAIKALVEKDAFYCAGWAKSVRRELLQNNQIEFEEGIIGEDQDWYYRVLLHVNQIKAIDKSFIVYRQRENSVTSTWKIKNLIDCLYIIKKWKTNLEGMDMEDALREALFHSLAKLYCNMLIAYACFNDKDKTQYKQELKDLTVLLRYGQNKRVQVIAKIYGLIGFAGTVFSLKLLNDINKLRRH